MKIKILERPVPFSLCLTIPDLSSMSLTFSPLSLSLTVPLPLPPSHEQATRSLAAKKQAW